MKKTKEEIRKEITDIFHAGVKAVDAGGCVRRAFSFEQNILTVMGQAFDLGKFKNIYVVGAGKATAGMALELEKILGNRISAGVISVKYGHTAQLHSIKIIEAGHPVPDRNGYRAAGEIIKTVEKASGEDMVICLISGGGSALMALPVAGISFDDKQALTNVLLMCGADIHEINTLRKNLSGIKGGGLARAAAPATIIGLMISDVIGNDPGVIASGPTVPYSCDYDECIGIISKYTLKNKVPESVLNYLYAGVQKTTEEQDFFNKHIFNVVIGDSDTALLAAKRKAENLGYNAFVLSSAVEGDTRLAANIHCDLALEIEKTGNPLKKPACVLSGGETTVAVSGSGRGGRNTEFALCAALKLSNSNNITLLSGGTDGTDGPTDAAGAIADSGTLARAEKAGLDPETFLQENDSYTFFNSLNDLLITGPTNTNVMDLRIMLIV